MVGCPKLIRGPYTESRGLAPQPASENHRIGVSSKLLPERKEKSSQTAKTQQRSGPSDGLRGTRGSDFRCQHVI